MKHFRIVLLPFAVVAELVLLFVCFCLALLVPALVARIVNWSVAVLPDRSWYAGE